MKARASCSSATSGNADVGVGMRAVRLHDPEGSRGRIRPSAELSTTSATVLKPTQRPDQRDIAQPCRPSSSRSRTSAGTSTGHRRRDQCRLALVRHGRGFAAVVVAGHRAARRRCARCRRSWRGGTHRRRDRRRGLCRTRWRTRRRISRRATAAAAACPRWRSPPVPRSRRAGSGCGSPPGASSRAHIWMSIWPSGEPR